jgi:hypothetical protein
MAVSRVKTSSILQGFPKSRSLLAGNAGYDPAATFLIQRQTATSSVTSFTFSSIPSTYKHLQIRCLSRRDTGVSHVVVLQFNGDTATNYWWHLLEGNGSTATSSSVSSATNRVQTFWPNPSVNLAGQFGAGIIDIHDYASTTKYKTVRCFGGGDANGTGKINLTSGVWNSTSAINSIVISFVGDTVVTGTTFALYGMKG